MKVVYFYMQFISHENRYILERLLHIFWILAMLALAQFHLLHISSFSYVSIIEEIYAPLLHCQITSVLFQIIIYLSFEFTDQVHVWTDCEFT